MTGRKNPTLTNLSTMLRRWRAMGEKSIRQAAEEIGTSAPTLMRIEHGYAMDGDTLMKVLNWMMKKDPRQ